MKIYAVDALKTGAMYNAPLANTRKAISYVYLFNAEAYFSKEFATVDILL